MRIQPAVWAAVCGVLLAAPSAAVDGVIEINQARASAGGVTPGDAAGFPVTLSQSGSYRLTGSLLTSSRATTLVEITAPRVTLDLNGFVVGACVGGGACGTGSTGRGISASEESEITIQNGTVRGTGAACISLGPLARIESVRVIGCGGSGIEASSQSHISNVLVREAAGRGIQVGTRSLVHGSTVVDNVSAGIFITAAGTLVFDTVISGNGAAIGQSSPVAGVSSGFRGCVITGNDGIEEVQPMPASGVVNLGHNVCGSDTICP